MVSDEKSPICEWYNGKSIFITGGSGFMGKVLIEKLLYVCPKLGNIYMLIREKRGNSPQKRIDDMWKLPCFERLREVQPNAIKKIIPVVGDLFSDDLGIKKSDLEALINNVEVVFHVAATLKLEATLKDAIEQNTAGTARVLDLAKKFKKLVSFNHFSTAFCSADIDVFEEKVYDCRENPRDVIEAARWMTTETLEKVKEALIAPHPNTYTYSKRLAEKLVADEAPNLPVCIIRPSIVIPAALEPVPGWVDSLNGPMGLMVGAGKGVIRSMHAKAENRVHFIPVDAAINAAITIAQKLGTMKKKPTCAEEVPVYNLTQDAVIPVTIGEVLDLGRQIAYDYPFEMQIWYPDGNIRSSKLVHQILCIFLHWIPAYFIDFLMFVFRQKRFMVRIQTKIRDGLELLEFFAVRQWNFKSEHFLSLYNEYMTDADRKILIIDFHLVDQATYMKTSILGARQYLMKEPLSSLPRCRIQQKILYVLHKALVWGFYYMLLKFVISMVGPLQDFFDSSIEYVKHAPLFREKNPIMN